MCYNDEFKTWTRNSKTALGRINLFVSFLWRSSLYKHQVYSLLLNYFTPWFEFLPFTENRESNTLCRIGTSDGEYKRNSQLDLYDIYNTVTNGIYKHADKFFWIQVLYHVQFDFCVFPSTTCISEASSRLIKIHHLQNTITDNYVNEKLIIIRSCSKILNITVCKYKRLVYNALCMHTS